MSPARHRPCLFAHANSNHLIKAKLQGEEEEEEEESDLKKENFCSSSLTSFSTLLDSFKWKQHLWQLHGPEQINPWEHAYEQASKFAPLLSGSRRVSVSVSFGRLFTFFHNHQVGFFY
jgi:hypothetical protein